MAGTDALRQGGAWIALNEFEQRYWAAREVARMENPAAALVHLRVRGDGFYHSNGHPLNINPFFVAASPSYFLGGQGGFFHAPEYKPISEFKGGVGAFLAAMEGALQELGTDRLQKAFAGQFRLDAPISAQECTDMLAFSARFALNPYQAFGLHPARVQKRELTTAEFLAAVRAAASAESETHRLDMRYMDLRKVDLLTALAAAERDETLWNVNWSESDFTFTCMNPVQVGRIDELRAEKGGKPIDASLIDQGWRFGIGALVKWLGGYRAASGAGQILESAR